MARILFAQNYRGELAGIASIASYLNQKHQVAVSLGAGRDIIEKYRSFKPDVIGIYVLTKDHFWATDLAAQIKSIDKNSVILLGGQHPTFYPAIMNDKNIDAICIGEGEKPVSNLLNKINAEEEYNDIPSLWVKRGGVVFKNKNESVLRPEEIPLQDVTLYGDIPGVSKSDSFTVMCSRGCPFSCNFCCQYQFKIMYGADRFRIRKTEDIIQEIESAKEQRSLKLIKFQDDIFGTDKRWLTDFLTEYRNRVGLPFYCLLRCEYIYEDMIDELMDAGCFRVGIGFECGSEYLRNGVLNKNLSDAAIENAVRVLKRKKLSFHSFSMFGFPQEDYRSALKTVDMNIRLKPDPAFSNIFQPYPGTKFFSEEVEASVISPSFNVHRINHSYSSDSAKIYRIQKLLALVVKIPALRFILPLLVRLPLDGLYDRISMLSWDFLYDRKFKKRV